MYIRKENLNLLRKIAWSFSETTHLEFDDLYSQACLIYCETISRYDRTRGLLSKFISTHVTRGLINYTKREYHWHGPEVNVNVDWMTHQESIFVLMDEVLSSVDPNVRVVIKEVLTEPERYLDENLTLNPKPLRKIMRKLHTNVTIKEIMNVLRSIEISNIFV